MANVPFDLRGKKVFVAGRCQMIHKLASGVEQIWKN